MDKAIDHIEDFRLHDVVRIFSGDPSLPSSALRIGKISDIFVTAPDYNNDAFIMIKLTYPSGFTSTFKSGSILPFMEHADRLTALVLFGVSDE